MASLLTLSLACRTAAEQELANIPDTDAQAQAQKLINEVYAELINAKTIDDKVAAARVLIMRANETHNAPAAKYVMYDTARSIAVDAGDTDAAMDAIDGLAASFEDNSGAGFLDVAAASLQDLSRRVRANSQHAAVAQAGIGVAERMIANDRLGDAANLLARLRSSATRSKRPELASAYKAMSEEMRIIRAEEQRIANDLKAIEQNPNDPALCLSVGKFLAMYRGEWQAGLPLLARSSDKALAAAAKADLAGASDAKTQIAIGDQWWEISSENPWIEHRSMTDRAKYWYRLALPASTGIERAVLTTRLAPSGQVKWGDLVLEPGIKTMIEADENTAGAQPGPIAKESSWVINQKPKGAEKKVKIHFEGYLYFPQTSEVGLMTSATASGIYVEVNGKHAVKGSSISEVPVQLIKGYNSIRGYISVAVVHLDNPKLVRSASITLTELDGKAIPISAEHWFHDATR